MKLVVELISSLRIYEVHSPTLFPSCARIIFLQTIFCKVYQNIHNKYFRSSVAGSTIILLKDGFIPSVFFCEIETKNRNCVSLQKYEMMTLDEMVCCIHEKESSNTIIIITFSLRKKPFENRTVH